MNAESCAVLLEGRKWYRCDVCSHLAKQKKEMTDHLATKKHAKNLKEFEEKEASAVETVPVVVTGTETVETITRPKMSGKSYLVNYCKDAIQMDRTAHYMTKFGRTYVFDDQDVNHYYMGTPTQFIVYLVIKIIKNMGVDKFPFRCVDVNRKRFFYNDAALGWTEDYGNLGLLLLVRELMMSIGCYINRLIKEELFIIDQEKRNEYSMAYIHWGHEIKSVHEELHKSPKRALNEKNEAITSLADILRVDTD